MRITNFLPYEWQIGLRYTRAGKRSGRNHFISFISMASVAGIALGVAALIVVLSVMNGFQQEVSKRMLSMVAHVEVYDASGALADWRATARQARANPQVAGAAPFLDAQAMLLAGSVMKPAMLRGIEPHAEREVSPLASLVKGGSLEQLAPGSFNVILGRALASDLDVAVGDRVTMLVADGAIVGTSEGGNALPRSRPLTVVGILESGHFEFDSTLALVNLADAEQASGARAPAGVRLRLADLHTAPQVAQQLQHTLQGEFFIRDWTRVNAIWFAAVESQKRMMFIILAMIVAVAAFNLVSTLVMTVKDKQADIAILRTIGASPGAIQRIFIVQGVLVGLLGAGLGVLLGVLVALNVDVIVPAIERLFGVHFLSQEVYLISEMPSDLRWADVAWIGGVAVLLSLLATLYPSWSAARVRPAQALRYE